MDSRRARWLLLIHQIPPTPAYLRVKIGRQLARAGAVALKNSVYLLPRSEAAVEHFQWIRREIVGGKGDATIVEAEFVDGVSDGEIEALFRNARDDDYSALIPDTRALAKRARAAKSRRVREELAGELARIDRRIEEIASIDFFGASGRDALEGLLRPVRDALAAVSAETPRDRESYRGRTWVTRTGIHVDRIASAWLIRRFIDRDARFKFVPAKGYVPEDGELRFDMFEAEFSHEGDECTFEVLCRRLGVDAPGLRAVREVVHDIDLGDEKFARPETAGVAAVIAGLALREREDVARLEHGSRLFEELLAYFARRKQPKRTSG